MRTLFSILLSTGIALGFHTASANAVESEPATALAISIGGIGPAVDSRALARVNQLIADGIRQDLFDRFIIHGRGHEGGYSGCLQINANASAKKIDLLEKRLQAIRANPATTAYSVERIPVCEPASDL